MITLIAKSNRYAAQFEKHYNFLMQNVRCDQCAAYIPLFQLCRRMEIEGSSELIGTVPDGMCEEFTNAAVDKKIDDFVSEDFENRPWIYCNADCSDCCFKLTRKDCLMKKDRKLAVVNND